MSTGLECIDFTITSSKATFIIDNLKGMGKVI